MDFAALTALVGELEGPYKKYIMVGAVFVLATFFTRFVFKTLKWVIAAIIVAVLVFIVWNYLNT